MKSYLSRFLHYTLSHSDVNPQSTPILSYSGLTRISRWNKFANLFDLDTPIKSECDTLEKSASTGRSMVEMLGVLAIIGVLSVGAIAGYSKVMMKYKLNKQAEQINQVVNALSQYHMQVHSETTISLVPIFKTLNLIPVEMIKDDSNIIYDIFGNDLMLRSNHYTDAYGSFYSTTIRYGINVTNQNNIEICRNIINTIKENSQSIYYLETIADWGAENGKHKTLFGDAYCSGVDKCLNSVSVNDIDNICRGYEKNTAAYMLIWWRS